MQHSCFAASWEVGKNRRLFEARTQSNTWVLKSQSSVIFQGAYTLCVSSHTRV